MKLDPNLNFVNLCTTCAIRHDAKTPVGTQAADGGQCDLCGKIGDSRTYPTCAYCGEVTLTSILIKFLGVCKPCSDAEITAMSEFVPMA